ncbi:hypothetical protein EZS27_014788 [termite gut metagenome]|uniref:Uncharacterized protein n=1 Tax=termite gut metagenome TaxID=433724 RepID=A0A5J4RT33_9ZZZZ
MRIGLLQKEREAVKFIRKAYQLALSMSDEGFHVAFSGGKDYEKKSIMERIRTRLVSQKGIS